MTNDVHGLKNAPISIVTLCAIWYHLHNLQKCEKHPWMSDTFGKVADFGLQHY